MSPATAEGSAEGAVPPEPGSAPADPSIIGSPLVGPPRTGLREAHAHIAPFGRSLSILDLSPSTSAEHPLNQLAGLAASIRAAPDSPAPPRATSSDSPRAWVRAFGARIESWREPRWFLPRELELAVGDLPCVVLSFDYHAAFANPLAMRLAGVVPGVSVPPNGVICVDQRGDPTGELLEDAAHKVWKAAPEPTIAEREQHVIRALERLSLHGFVEVHDLLAQPWLGPLLRRLEDAGRLPVESVWIYPPVEEWPAEHPPWASERVRLAGAKLFADGTLNSRTALMLNPYKEGLPGMPCGKAMVSAEQIDDALRRVSSGASRFDPAASRGHLAVHAIGDGAVRRVLDAVERMNPRADDLGLIARIEHAELIDEQDVPRFARLGVVCGVQPCHLLYDIEPLRRYAPDRLDRVLPLRELLDAGLHAGMLSPSERVERRKAAAARSVAGPGDPGGGVSEIGGCGEVWFGSDVPIVDPNPADSILAATRRARNGMNPSLAIAPEQRLEEEVAWACFR